MISPNMLNSSRIRAILVVLLLTALLSGCGDSGATPSALPTVNPTVRASFPLAINPKIAALPPFTLKVWFADDYYNEPPIVDLMNEFKQAYPNISIVVNHALWDKMRSKLRDAVNSSDPPDVAHQHAFVMGAQGFAEPLDDLWQQWGQAAQGSFMPGAMEDTRWGKATYGVPLDINTIFLIYNKQMFQEAGLALPGSDYTYPRLLEAARKLTKLDGSQYGIAVKAGGWDFFGLLRSNGGSLTDEGGGQATAQFDSPANIEMLQYLAELVGRERVSPLLRFNQGVNPVQLFKEGKIAMFFSGPWDLKDIEKKEPALYKQVGTASLPKGFYGKTNGSVQGGGSLFVPKGSKHREAAFEFMKWATSPKYQMRLAREMGRYPVLNDLYKDPYFTEQPLLQPYLQQLKTALPYKLEAYSLADVIWEQTIAAILNGSDVKETLADANKSAQAAINAARLKQGR